MLSRMKALTLAPAFLSAMLSLNVAVSAFAQATAAKPAAQQEAPKPPPTIVQLVRAQIDAGNIAKAENLVLGEIADGGTTPIAVEAFSWLGRGYLGLKKYDEAVKYAQRTYTIVEEQLKTRKLDDEPRLPIALGASIEVQAQAMADQAARSEAILFLKSEMERYKGTSIITRLTKNLNMIGLEGQPAYAINATDWLTTQRTSMADLKGKPVILFMWAHWCSDCKIFGPIVDAAIKKYRGTGLTVVPITQPFGYVARREPASLDVERAYTLKIRDEYYPWMKDLPMPVSTELYGMYGVSTSPTVVFVDRAGNVQNYHPGRLTTEELDSAITAITASSSAPKRP